MTPPKKRKLEIMILAIIVPIVISAAILFAGCGGEDINAPLREGLNLGITFEEFKNKYNKQSKKITQNDIGASLVMMFDEHIKYHAPPAPDYVCRFSFSDSFPVFVTVGIDEKTKKIWYIEVFADAAYINSKDEIATMLELQSTVYSIAASVFNSKWENKNYRESSLKLLYTVVTSTKYEFVEKNIRYKAKLDTDTKLSVLTIEAENWFYTPYEKNNPAEK